MSELSSLDDLRRLFEEIAEAKIGDFDNDKLSIDYNCSLNEIFDKYADLLCHSIKTLSSGKADDLIAQSVLMIRKRGQIYFSGRLS